MTYGLPDMRIGQGFDIHPFSDDPSRPLILGGIRFDDGPGLTGHSDADALCHAITDALLGAAGLGDIGMLFPDTDPAFAGADSVVMLLDTVSKVRAAGWAVANVDCTVIAERPKIQPHREAMQSALSACVGAPVTVKGKRGEGMGALGRAEGIACLASALLIASDW